MLRFNDHTPFKESPCNIHDTRDVLGAEVDRGGDKVKTSSSWKMEDVSRYVKVFASLSWHSAEATAAFKIGTLEAHLQLDVDPTPSQLHECLQDERWKRRYLRTASNGIFLTSLILKIGHHGSAIPVSLFAFLVVRRRLQLVLGVLRCCPTLSSDDVPVDEPIRIDPSELGEDFFNTGSKDRPQLGFKRGCANQYLADPEIGTKNPGNLSSA